MYIGALAPSYLQSVPPVPITSLFEHLLGLGDVGGGDGVVIVEQAHSDVQEHQVHPIAQANLFNDEGGKKREISELTVFSFVSLTASIAASLSPICKRKQLNNIFQLKMTFFL